MRVGMLKLAFLGPGLLAFIFFVKVHIPREKVGPFWLMAFVFHIPFLLFVMGAILVEIIDWKER